MWYWTHLDKQNTKDLKNVMQEIGLKTQAAKQLDKNYLKNKLGNFEDQLKLLKWKLKTYITNAHPFGNKGVFVSLGRAAKKSILQISCLLHN